MLILSLIFEYSSGWSRPITFIFFDIAYVLRALSSVGGVLPNLACFSSYLLILFNTAMASDLTFIIYCIDGDGIINELDVIIDKLNLFIISVICFFAARYSIFSSL